MNADSNDTYCYRSYSLQLRCDDAATSTCITSYQAVTPGSHDFITAMNIYYSFATPYVSNNLYASDQTFLSGVQTRNYTLKMVIQLTIDSGNALEERTTTLSIDSLCPRVTFTNETILDSSLIYHIRQSAMTQNLVQLIPSFADSTYTTAQLYTECGNVNYVLFDTYSDTIPTHKTLDSTTLFTAFSGGSSSTASTLTYWSDDSTKGGENFGTSKINSK